MTNSQDHADNLHSLGDCQRLGCHRHHYQPTADDVLAIMDAWSSPDDWNVPSIYVSIVRDLLGRIERREATVQDIIDEPRLDHERGEY